MANLASTLRLRQLESKAYKLAGKTTFAGMSISIETKKGQIRKGIDSHGQPWKVVMPFDYGYILGTKGVDKDHVDCFIGKKPKAKFAYIIHQMKDNSKTYDEDKVMLGWDSADEALVAYKSAYNNVDLFMAMTILPIKEFKKKVYATKKKPAKIVAQLDGDYYQYPLMQPMVHLHPPSLKNPVEVPTDDDDLGKKKKMSKKKLKYIKEQTRRNGKPEIVETTLTVDINQQG